MTTAVTEKLDQQNHDFKTQISTIVRETAEAKTILNDFRALTQGLPDSTKPIIESAIAGIQSQISIVADEIEQVKTMSTFSGEAEVNLSQLKTSMETVHRSVQDLSAKIIAGYTTSSRHLEEFKTEIQSIQRNLTDVMQEQAGSQIAEIKTVSGSLLKALQDFTEASKLSSEAEAEAARESLSDTLREIKAMIQSITAKRNKQNVRRYITHMRGPPVASAGAGTAAGSGTVAGVGTAPMGTWMTFDQMYQEIEKTIQKTCLLAMVSKRFQV
jgi:hypothetical protein